MRHIGWSRALRLPARCGSRGSRGSARIQGQRVATPLETPEPRDRDPRLAPTRRSPHRPTCARLPPPTVAPERVACHRRVVDGGLRRSGAPEPQPSRPALAKLRAARIGASPRPLVQHTGEPGAQRDADAEPQPAGRRPDHPARHEGAGQEGRRGHPGTLPVLAVRRGAPQRFIWLSRYFRIPAP